MENQLLTCIATDESRADSVRPIAGEAIRGSSLDMCRVSR